MKKTLVKILQSQGFGSRKECTWLIEKTGVTIDGHNYRDPKQSFETDALQFEIASQPWQYRPQIYILLHKQTGYECSANPQHHLSVLEELPQQFINRNIRIAGRLDVDTTGLLLLSDDGKFIHHVTSPKRELPKTYRVDLKHPFNQEQADKLSNGVNLNNEEGIFIAHDLEIISDQQIHFAIKEGCYHQVKRMVAAVSNRVEQLSRIGIGELTIQHAPDSGNWCYLNEDELQLLGYAKN